MGVDHSIVNMVCLMHISFGRPRTVLQQRDRHGQLFLKERDGSSTHARRWYPETLTVKRALYDAAKPKCYFYYVHHKMDNFGQVAVKIVNGAYMLVYCRQGPLGPIQSLRVCACVQCLPLCFSLFYSIGCGHTVSFLVYSNSF